MATANPTALFTTLPRTEFIQKNLGLVHSCAGRFTGRGIEYEELYSAGCLGLVKACDGFDPDRGVCFSSYAVPVILGEIKKLFRDGAEPTVAQLAQNLGATPEQVAVSIQAAMPVVSLTPADDEDGTREWDSPVDSPEEVLAERISLAEILKRLNESDRQLIRLRFYAGKTQSKTAQILGTTQVQISRRERKILKWMRKELTSE